MNWFLVTPCAILAALFPDLPLLACLIWGQQSHMPVIVTGAILFVSAGFALAHIFTKAVLGGRFLASAFATVAVMGIITGLLALGGLLSVISPNYYNVFRGFPSHMFQALATVFMGLHLWNAIMSENEVTKELKVGA